MTDAIRTESLTKYYGRVVGVERLDLRVQSGEIYGFLGPNGAGKTTTIRLLLDLLRPTRGRALINGLDTRLESRAVRAQVGYLPAEMALYPEMSGRAFLDFLSGLQRAPVDREWRRRLFARFAIGEVDVRRRLGDLSHGMKRKFGIIQALMGRPRVLILDEPTSGLDPLMIEAFTETVAEIKKEGTTTIFLSSHVLSEVERLCDRIGIIRRGTLARETSLSELRRQMPRRVRLTFAGTAPSPPPAIASSVRVYAGRGFSPGAGVVGRGFSPGESTAGVAGRGFSPGEGTNSNPGAGQWDVEWRGPLGELLAAIDTADIADIEIEPFKLEDYVLGVYSEGA